MAAKRKDKQGSHVRSSGQTRLRENERVKNAASLCSPAHLLSAPTVSNVHRGDRTSEAFHPVVKTLTAGFASPRFEKLCMRTSKLGLAPLDRLLFVGNGHCLKMWDGQSLLLFRRCVRMFSLFTTRIVSFIKVGAHPSSDFRRSRKNASVRRRSCNPVPILQASIGWALGSDSPVTTLRACRNLVRWRQEEEYHKGAEHEK